LNNVVSKETGASSGTGDAIAVIGGAVVWTAAVLLFNKLTKPK
jgi:hypothetical protein